MKGLSVLALSLMISSLASWAADAPSISGSAPPKKELELFPDEILAKGKGFEIRRTELENAVAALRATAASQGQSVPESRPGEIDQKVFERLVLNRICTQKATAEDKAKAKEDADKIMADTRKRAPSEESFKRQLLVVGLTPEQYGARVLEQAVVEKVIDRELRSTIKVTPEQIKEFYETGVDAQVRDVQATVDKLAQGSSQTAFYTDGKKRVEDLKAANLAKLNRQETIRAVHILIFTVDKLTREDLPENDKKARRALMEKTLARVKGGEDFSKVAREVSEDPDVAQSGGEYTLGRETNMAPELKAALFALPVGQLSDIIETKYGMHIARVLERNPAGKPPLEKIEKEIKEHLENQEVLVRLPAYFDKLKKEFQVEIPSASTAK